MNKILGLLAIMVVFCVGLSPVQAKNKTPITPETYMAFIYSCTDECVSSTTTRSKLDAQTIRIYCGCVCAASSMHLRTVVSNHHLNYEEDLPPYMSEVMPSKSEVNTCLNKAVN